MEGRLCWFCFLLGLPLLQANAPAVGWFAGAVCDGTNSTVLTRDFLRGKHLHVYDVAWVPFAVVDASAPHGWT
eukprot:2151782-Prymnesium_polylepis.1